MLIKDVLEKSNQFLKSKGIESSRLDSELIISNILKMERITLYLKYDQPLFEEEIIFCRQKILERSKGVPVAYLINKKYFYNYEFYVNNQVLIPRPETEILVEDTLSWIKQEKLLEVSLLDLGCGSGCIAIAIVTELLKMKIKINKAVAIDISPAAIEVSTVNANNILTDYQPIEFIVSDAVDFSSDISFDVIVSNPPYISNSDLDIQKSVKDFEPHLALFAKEEGMFCIKMWILTSLKMLKPKGFLMFEMGHNQGAAVQKILSDSMEFSSVELINDFSGLNRFIKAVRNG